MKVKPLQIIFLSYLLAMFVGGLLLFLPVSQNNGLPPASFIDCVFTATSALCVTGLVVVTTAEHWTLFGQIVILLLIQVGGLGIITIRSFFYIIIGKKLNFEDRILMQNSLNQSQVGGMVKMTSFVIKSALFFEGIGAILLTSYFFFAERLSFPRSLYFGIFHAVSAFCNAGFDVIGSNSLVDYSGSPFIMLTIGSLIIIGGIGFFVWRDVLEKIKNRRHRLSVSSYLAIVTTVFLLVAGTLYFFLAEFSNPLTLGTYSVPHKLLASFFQSTTLRTAGFSALNQYGLKEMSKLMSCIFMIIGGSPGSIAGGIKTVTMAVIFLSVWGIIRGKEGIVVRNRAIVFATLQKALAIMAMMILLTFSFTLLLSISETNSLFNYTLVDLAFEATSALGTVGLTTGITPFLTNVGRIALTAAMLVGRVGPLTVIYSLTTPKKNPPIKYPETDVLIG